MKILLCVAGMPCAEATVRFGGEVARITQSSVTLLHIARPSERRPGGERVLALARELLPGLAVDMHIRWGSPTRRILAEAQEGDYDLVIVGASQAVRLRRRLLGSVALRVACRASISVLVVRQAKPSLERVLICTGGADVSKPVVETGAWLAGAAQAQATLLHIVNSVPIMYTGLDGIEETLPELLQTDAPLARHLRQGVDILVRRRVAAELKLCYGVVADEIFREAYEGDHDLIAIGASGAAGQLKGWLLGNVTRRVVEHAPCSVLVIRPIHQVREGHRAIQSPLASRGVNDRSVREG